MNPEDFPVMVEAFELHSACVAIEINLSCPNVIGKAQVGYDFDDTRDVLEKVCRYKNRLAFGVKLPPYFDFAYYEMMVKVLLDFPIDFITCINTVGNTLILDPIHHKPVLKPKWGFGGLAWPVVKPIALANVRKFYELIGDKIQIVGCGGVTNGIDAYEYALCWASAVQMATAYNEEGYGVFGRVKQEAQEYTHKQGWENIDAAKGKLQVL